MNALALKQDSGPLLEEDFKTYPRSSSFGIIGEMTKERIKSFFEDVDETIEESEDENVKKNSNQTIPFALNKRDPIAIIPDRIPISHTFKSLSKWEGHVIEVQEDSFLARIVDLNDETQDEEVEIEIDDISLDDRVLIQVGAIFNWHIGKENLNGTIKKSSIITFRRMPRWTKNDFKKAEIIRRQLAELFKVD